MQGAGATVRYFKTGAAVLDTLRDTPADAWPDVLICDVTLDDMDGYAMVAAVRQLEAERGTSLAHRLPAIAISGHAASEGRLRALMAGYQTHCARPADTQSVIHTTAKLMSEKFHRL